MNAPGIFERRAVTTPETLESKRRHEDLGYLVCNVLTSGKRRKVM